MYAIGQKVRLVTDIHAVDVYYNQNPRGGMVVEKMYKPGEYVGDDQYNHTGENLYLVACFGGVIRMYFTETEIEPCN